MKAGTLFVVSKERRAGAFFIVLGLMEILRRSYKRIAVFKPIVESEDDEDIDGVLKSFDLVQKREEAWAVTEKDALRYLADGDEEELYESIISHYEKLKSEYDFVLCIGFGKSDVSRLTDFDMDLKVAKNLSAPVAGVINADGKSQEAINEEMAIWYSSLKRDGLKPIALFVNRVRQKLTCSVKRVGGSKGVPCFMIPYKEELDRPTVMDIMDTLDAKLLLLKSRKQLERSVKRVLVAAMHPEHFLERLKEGDIVVTPADRSDILLAVYAANHSPDFPAASAVVVGGGFDPADSVLRLLGSDENFRIAVVSTPEDTISIAAAAQRCEARLTSGHRRKIDLAIGHFQKYVDTSLIEESLENSSTGIVTPAMFLHRIFASASALKKDIVLPESDDGRILQAAETILRRNIAKVTLLGDESDIRNRAGILGVDLDGATFVDPAGSGCLDRYAKDLYELRKDKGLTLDGAYELLGNRTYFGTMMVKEGAADGMVCGATHTTRETVLPALQIIKTKPGIDIVSSIFFMCLDTRVLVYGDCAIVPDPDPKELAQIAVCSAMTAKSFGIEPVVALLSYSSGESGVGKDVQKVKEAARIAAQMAPEIPIEGPLQYDAAIDPEVAGKKMPGSSVAGRATVFIFPDLNTGNNTYKAVQRATGAIAIGPVLQGLDKPVNDLSRGCSVDDIVSTVAITAIQAGKS